MNGISLFTAISESVAAFSKLISSKSTFDVTLLTPANGEDSMLKTAGIFRANITSPTTAMETFSREDMSSLTRMLFPPIITVAVVATKIRIAKSINNPTTTPLNLISYSSAITASSSSLNNWSNIHSASYSMMSSYPWPIPKNIIGFLIT